MITGKYRIWCENKNEWEKDPCFLDPYGGLWHRGKSGVIIEISRMTHIVEFYTGLKDKNGVEIYEGDIITTEGMKPIIIKWRESFHVGNFAWKTIGFTVFDGINIETGKPIFEKIGTIHENAELMGEL